MDRSQDAKPVNCADATCWKASCSTCRKKAVASTKLKRHPELDAIRVDFETLAFSEARRSHSLDRMAPLPASECNWCWKCDRCRSFVHEAKNKHIPWLALDYYRTTGCVAIPLDSSKAPIISGFADWYHPQYKPTEEELSRIFHHHASERSDYLGYATLLGNIVCLDFDTAEGAEQAKAWWPDHKAVTFTGKGAHYFFTPPWKLGEFPVAHILQCNLVLGGKKAERVDFKTYRSYTVGAGSWHAKSCKRYRSITPGVPWWRNEVPPLDMNIRIERVHKDGSTVKVSPSLSLQEFIDGKKTQDQEATTRKVVIAPAFDSLDSAKALRAAWNYCKKAGAISTERHRSLYNIACKLTSYFALSQEDAQPILEWVNANKCTDPLPDSEIAKLIRDTKYAKKHDYGQWKDWKPPDCRGGYINFHFGGKPLFGGKPVSKPTGKLVPHDPVAHGPIAPSASNEHAAPSMGVVVALEIGVETPKPPEAPVGASETGGAPRTGPAAPNPSPSDGSETYEREPGEDEWELPEKERNKTNQELVAWRKECDRKKNEKQWRSIYSTKPREKREVIRFDDDAKRSMLLYAGDRQHWTELVRRLQNAFGAKDKTTATKKLQSANSILGRCLTCGEYQYKRICEGRSHLHRKTIYCAHTYLCVECCRTQARWYADYIRQFWKDGSYTVITTSRKQTPSAFGEIKGWLRLVKDFLSRYKLSDAPHRYWYGYHSACIVLPTSVYEAIKLRRVPDKSLFTPEIICDRDFNIRANFMSKEEMIECVMKTWREPSEAFYALMVRLQAAIDSGQQSAQAKLANEIIHFAYMNGGQNKRTHCNRGGHAVYGLADRKEIARMAREARLKEFPELALIPSDRCSYVDQHGEFCGCKIERGGSLYRRGTLVAKIDPEMEDYKRKKFIENMIDAYNTKLGEKGFDPQSFYTYREQKLKQSAFRTEGKRMLLVCLPRNL